MRRLTFIIEIIVCTLFSKENYDQRGIISAFYLKGGTKSFSAKNQCKIILILGLRTILDKVRYFATGIPMLHAANVIDKLLHSIAIPC